MDDRADEARQQEQHADVNQGENAYQSLIAMALVLH